VNQLTLIPRLEEGQIIPQRMRDGYISATALCKSVGKRFSDYKKLKTTQAFLSELCTQLYLSEEDVIHTISGGEPKLQGTWVHPDLAINLGQWLSPKFAVKVSRWVREWLQGEANAKAVNPIHIERYMLNRSKVPYTHFAMLNELTLHLIAPLEQSGYIMPPEILPDISEGRMFCKWLRDNRGIEPNTFPTYEHEYPDGRVYPAKLYPLEFYEDFKRHFYEIWLPKQAPKYFAKDQNLLQLIQILLLPSN
jgi:hypothetical protein